MERTTVIDMMADSLWTLAALEAESEGLRKANVGIRCRYHGEVIAYTRILAVLMDLGDDGSNWVFTLLEREIRGVLKSLTESPAASAEEARSRVHAGLKASLMGKLV